MNYYLHIHSYLRLSVGTTRLFVLFVHAWYIAKGVTRNEYLVYPQYTHLSSLNFRNTLLQCNFFQRYFPLFFFILIIITAATTGLESLNFTLFSNFDFFTKTGMLNLQIPSALLVYISTDRDAFLGSDKSAGECFGYPLYIYIPFSISRMKAC